MCATAKTFFCQGAVAGHRLPGVGVMRQPEITDVTSTSNRSRAAAMCRSPRPQELPTLSDCYAHCASIKGVASEQESSALFRWCRRLITVARSPAHYQPPVKCEYRLAILQACLATLTIWSSAES